MGHIFNDKTVIYMLSIILWNWVSHMHPWINVLHIDTYLDWLLCMWLDTRVYTPREHFYPT